MTEPGAGRGWTALEQQDALELVKTGAGRVALVTGLSPLETLRVAQSPFAKVIKTRGPRRIFSSCTIPLPSMR